MTSAAFEEKCRGIMDDTDPGWRERVVEMMWELKMRARVYGLIFYLVGFSCGFLWGYIR